MGKMRTKRFFKFSFDSLFFQAVIFAALVGCIYVLTRITGVVFVDMPPDERWKGILFYILFVLSVPTLLYFESTFWVGVIHLEDKRIRSRGDNRLPKEKIQYPASVEYKDIAEISISPLRKNSKGDYLSLSRPLPYLCIRKKNGKWVRFSLHFMSRATVRRLLEDLQNRCASTGIGVSMNLNELLTDFMNARWAIKGNKSKHK